jgi:hypothetical protein
MHASGRTSRIPVQLSTGAWDYETAMVVVEPHEDCKEWLNKRVEIHRGSGYTATVRQFNLPMRLCKTTSLSGPLEAGHVLLRDVSCPSKVSSTKNYKEIKFKKNMLVTMDGTCSETIKDAISRSPGGLFVQTTVLVLAEDA